MVAVAYNNRIYYSSNYGQTFAAQAPAGAAGNQPFVSVTLSGDGDKALVGYGWSICTGTGLSTASAAWSCAQPTPLGGASLDGQYILGICGSSDLTTVLHMFFKGGQIWKSTNNGAGWSRQTGG